MCNDVWGGLLCESLQAKTFRRPVSQVKCKLETEAAVECYKTNSQNPLACSKLVSVSPKLSFNPILFLGRAASGAPEPPHAIRVTFASGSIFLSYLFAEI